MTQGLASLPVDGPVFGTQQVQALQEGAAVTEPQNGSDSQSSSQALPRQGGNVGIMVFSSACKMLYMNPTAYVFLILLNRWETGHATHGALPGSVADLFDEMQLALASRMRNGVCERLEARRVLVAQAQTVLLQAFGLPDGLRMAGSRVVITVQGVVPPAEDTSSDAISASS